MKKRILTKEEKDLALKLYEEGKSITEIGREIECRPMTISEIAKESGIFIPRRNIIYKKKISNQEIKELFEKFKSIRRVGQELGLQSYAIRKALEEENIKGITSKERDVILEEDRNEIIEMFLDPFVSRKTILDKFKINRITFRRLLEKWGVFRKNKVAKKPLEDYNVDMNEVVKEYKSLDNIAKVAEKLKLPASVISLFLKKAGVLITKTEKKRIINNDKEIILERYLNLETSKEIAKDYGVYNSTIIDYLHKWGADVESRQVKILRSDLQENKDKIIKMFLDGFSTEEIGDEVGRKRQQISKFLKKNGYFPIDPRVRESSLERRFKKTLEELDIGYEQHFGLCARIYDFYIEDYQLLIEINGDYWHNNPKIYKDFPEDKKREAGQKRDDVKFNMARAYDFNILFIWESEMNNHADQIIKILKNLKYQIPNQSSPIDFLTDNHILK